MMIKLNEIMLYVNDQQKVADFWVGKLDFVIESKQDYGEAYFLVLSDGRENSTKLVLQNKAVVAASEPMLNLETPSILLTTDDIDGLYQKFQDENVTVGEKVVFPDGKKVFNFADPEGNYFAIIEE